MANGVRKVYERIFRDGRAIIVTDKNKDNYDWADIPDGSLFVDSETGLEYVKLKGQSDWVPSHTKNDGTICIAKDAIIETETFIVKEINDDDLVCENENGDTRHFMQDEDGFYVIELESGTYGMGKDYLSVFINDIFLRTQQNEGIQEMTPSRFKLLEKPALNMKITAKYYKTIRIGNPYPRIFINKEDPGAENAEEGDLWIDVDDKIDENLNIDDFIDSTGKIPWTMIKETPTTLEGYKITDRVSLQGHLHTKKDITDFPTTMTANGGHADTATKLATPRTINGVAFDGTSNIKIETGVKTVNGEAPDENGNVNLSGIPVGFMTFCLSKSIPVGWLACMGGTYLAKAHEALWNYILEQNSYKSFSEWQTIYNKNNGNVPFFAVDMSGSESDWQFKLPNIVDWVKGAKSLNEVGTYVEAGLPNITGTFHGNKFGNNATGAFYDLTENGKVDGDSQSASKPGTAFDASLSNSIYGKSDTVQPPSVVGMWIIKAFDNVTNVKNQDLNSISAALTQVEARIGSLENRVNLDEKAYIVKSYKNDVDWYRTWSDGWIEQGGYKLRTGVTTTVTLNLPFTKEDYVVLGTSGKNGYEQNSSTIDPTRTTTSFTWYTRAGDINGLYWYACGY